MIKATTCPTCGQDFEYDTKVVKYRYYCSKVCRRKAFYKQRQQQIGQDRPCSKCQIVKPSSAFSSGTHAYCRPCHAQYMQERRPIIADDVIRYRRVGHLRRHGLTLEGFDELVSSQGGRCAICATTEPGGSGVWHVDHDHACCNGRRNTCGQCTRGLLCNRCNIGIGSLQDDPEILRSAASYIERFRNKER